MLYIHIPFCKQACSYCNFHFSTSMKTRDTVMDGINKELLLRRGELAQGPVPSVYFGGGTPSLLTEAELGRLFTTMYDNGYLLPPTSVTAPTGSSATESQDQTKVGADAGAKKVRRSNAVNEKNARRFQEAPLPWGGVGEGTEITLEANPDDLTPATIQMLADSPVNRLSIGIQSFFEEDLRFMNRAHSATEAREAISKVTKAGFHDVSIDLIYGGQTTTDAMWAENLRIATDLGVTHISAYALTVEPKTALGVQVERGNVPDTDDAKFDRHFNMLVEHLTNAGYQHYEISNFCLPGHHSKHNSGYWSGQTYLGIGPGAHGFDGKLTRRWNVSNNAGYAKALAEINTPEDYIAANGFLFEEETLSLDDRYNEYIMTGLRRDVGVDVADLRRLFGEDKVRYFVSNQQRNIAEGLFEDVSAGVYRLTRAGRMRADGVAGDGFWV
jgi:oxygen-independent coproporphyrinogen-3 oxidase